MTGALRRLGGSLATRLVGLFTVGALLVFLLLGASLTLMLRSELRARDLEELDGKTAVVEHHLQSVRSAEDLVRSLPRFADTAVGHAHLQFGVMVSGRWLLRPEARIADLLSRRGVEKIAAGRSFEMIRDGNRAWWVRRVSRGLEDASAAHAHAIVAVDVSDALRVQERFNVALAMIGSTGILLMAALAWWAARSSLAPLARIAADAQRVTAGRLGEPLSIEEAPEEIRGVVAGINRMLARLDDSFSSLEQFSADIAHELRTPLNSLMLRVEVTLSRERASTEYRDALLGTMQELESLHKMVSDMLFIARAERGMAVASMQTVDLAAEARDVIEYFEPLASERGLSAVVDGEASVGGDRSMIRRAITNLLSNAVRYSSDGTLIEVKIETDPETVRFSVRNRCEPMSVEQVGHLFDRFARGESSRKDPTEGAGLGLAIVRSIMRLHGGTAVARPTDHGLQVELLWLVATNPNTSPTT